MAAVQFSGGIGPGQGQALTAAVPAAHQRLTVRPVGMAGGLGQTGRTGGRHGMVARFARVIQNDFAVALERFRAAPSNPAP